MRRLKPKDGVAVYLRTLLFIVRSTMRYPATKAIGEPLRRFVDALRAASQEVADAIDAQTEATADAQLADFEADDTVRELHTEAALLDRRDATLGVQARLFPDGLATVVARTGDAQAEQLDHLGKRLQSTGQPDLIKRYCARLLEHAARLREAEQVQSKAFARVGAAHASVRLQKTRVREELEAVYGALRIVFKAAPKRAERFFPSAAARKRVEEAEQEPADTAAEERSAA